MQKGYLQYRDIKLPKTMSLSNEVLSLPISPVLTIDELERIVYLLLMNFKWEYGTKE
jgi:dTDP-4-amino-4,6-dideoxygalactose transaminase